MNLQKFDIVLANFPFTDLSATKVRPALILKNFEGNNALIAQITKQRHELQKYEIFLKKEHCEGALRVDSYIYVDIITTLHKKRLIKKIGIIKSDAVKKEILNKLKLMLFD